MASFKMQKESAEFLCFLSQVWMPQASIDKPKAAQCKDPISPNAFPSRGNSVSLLTLTVVI
jgi:hypothetical protein